MTETTIAQQARGILERLGAGDPFVEGGDLTCVSPIDGAVIGSLRSHTAEQVTEVIDRSAGTTASFLKELVRRSVLESLRERAPLRTVTATHVRAALDDLLDSGEHITRALLGVEGTQASAGVGRASGGHGGMAGRHTTGGRD